MKEAQMKLRSPFFIVIVGIWTALTLGGSSYLGFGNPIMTMLTSQSNLHISELSRALVGVLIIYLAASLGGGLWSAGLAHFWGGVRWTMARALTAELETTLTIL